MKTKRVREYQKKIEKRVRDKPTSFLSKLYMQVIQFARPVFYFNEFLLINGIRVAPKSKRTSVIFFTIHKSASTFIKNTIIKLVNDKQIKTIDFSGYLSKSKQEKYYNSKSTMQKALVDKGYFFGAIRSYYNFPNLDKYKVLLLLRDPRDVLTSYYFSTLYNHPLGRKEVFEEREKNIGIGIDEFVLDKADEFKKRYNDYCLHLLGRENVLLLKYEDMVSDFKNWLIRLSQFLELKNVDDRIEQIVHNTSFRVEKENPHSFIRSIKPGNYKEKLKSETIELLNNIFRSELLQLNYNL